MPDYSCVYNHHVKMKDGRHHAANKAAALYSHLSPSCNELPDYPHPKCTCGESQTGELTLACYMYPISAECRTQHGLYGIKIQMRRWSYLQPVS